MHSRRYYILNRKNRSALYFATPFRTSLRSLDYLRIDHIDKYQSVLNTNLIDCAAERKARPRLRYHEMCNFPQDTFFVALGYPIRRHFFHLHYALLCKTGWHYRLEIRNHLFLWYDNDSSVNMITSVKITASKDSQFRAKVKLPVAPLHQNETASVLKRNTVSNESSFAYDMFY